MKILITGTTSGIGKACTLDCLNKGHQVIGISRTAQASTFDHPNFFPYSIDLSKLEDLESQFKKILSDHPDIEAAILSAGAPLFGYLEQLTSDDIRSLIDLNFTSQAIVSKALLPSMKKNSHGTIVFIGSEAALAGKPQGSIYCASKFALRGFCQALRKECAKSNVRISIINPGMVETPFFDSLYFKPKAGKEHACSPQEVATLILNQVECDSSFVIDEINLSPLKHHVVIDSQKEKSTLTKD